jgi:hypothetical protein
MRIVVTVISCAHYEVISGHIVAPGFVALQHRLAK